VTPPAPALELGRGLDLRGERFGKLEPLHVVEKRQPGNVWLCLCQCGRFAKRTAAGLQASIKRGRVPQCNGCRELAARACERYPHPRDDRTNGRRRRMFVVLWERHGTLYNDRALAREVRELRREIAERFEIDEPELEPAPALPIWAVSLGDAIDAIEMPARDRSAPRMPTGGEPRRYWERRIGGAAPEELDQALRRARGEAEPAPARRAPAWVMTPAPSGCRAGDVPHFYIDQGEGVAQCRFCGHVVRFNPRFPITFAKPDDA
jgi:hypothetical protein